MLEVCRTLLATDLRGNTNCRMRQIAYCSAPVCPCTYCYWLKLYWPRPLRLNSFFTNWCWLTFLARTHCYFEEWSPTGMSWRLIWDRLRHLTTMLSGIRAMVVGLKVTPIVVMRSNVLRQMIFGVRKWLPPSVQQRRSVIVEDFRWVGGPGYVGRWRDNANLVEEINYIGFGSYGVPSG